MNYWVVGATFDGVDVSGDFYKQGSWKMGWDTGDKTNYDDLFSQIKEGDRIAIKKMDGRGATTITIEAIGIVKDVEDGVVFVNWLVTGLERQVPSKGCFKTIHPPFSGGDEWTNTVFSI